MNEMLSENPSQKQQEREENNFQNQERIEQFDKMVEQVEKKSAASSVTSIEDVVVKELNKTHAVVHIDQFYILTEKTHSFFKGIDFTLESKQSFLNTYENQIVDYVHSKPRTKAKIWLSHPNRRQYHGITFDPTTTEHKEGLYNIWKGFAIKPKPGVCTLIKSHIEHVICNGNQGYFAYIWKWTARLVQKPNELSPGLVLMGEQGIGKNTLVDTIGEIFGQHYLPLDNIDQFLGHFNFHLKNAVLIHGNEAIWGGDKRQLGKLKAMVTERLCVIEGKGKDQLTMKNFKHLILSSNEDWPVHLDRDDRRFFVLKVSNKHKDDKEYFSKIYAEINNDGTAALLYELLATDISAFNVWQIPESNEAFEIKMISADSTEKYLYEVLCSGGFDIGAVNQEGHWENSLGLYEMLTNLVYTDYSNWCDYQKLPKKDEAGLGKAIFRLIPKTVKKRSRKHDKKFHYEFPPFGEARQCFQQAYKTREGIWG